MLESALPPDLAALLPDAAASAAPGTVAGLPALPGAYLLVCRLAAPLKTLPDRFTGKHLDPGWYIYAGSARGPGGIAARLGRHLDGTGKRRWHIDALTMTGAARAGFAYPGSHECGLVTRLFASGAFTIPLPGFGSSDCRQCASHLLLWQ